MTPTSASRRASARQSARRRAQKLTVNTGVCVNTEAWTDPVAQGGPRTLVHRRQLTCGNDQNITALPVSADISPNPLYDGWFTVISPNGRTAYDLWRAHRLADTSISFDTCASGTCTAQATARLANHPGVAPAWRCSPG